MFSRIHKASSYTKIRMNHNTKHFIFVILGSYLIGIQFHDIGIVYQKVINILDNKLTKITTRSSLGDYYKTHLI